jgi:hypothetical protein
LSVGALQELSTLYLHEYGIFIELDPDADEKQLVENNIQTALSRDQIDLEDVIDIRQVKNIKLANQLLKHRKARKIALDQQRAERNIAAQSQANAQAAQAAEMAKAQAEAIKAESKIKVVQAQTEFETKKLMTEADVKKNLMQYEFELNLKLKEMELNNKKEIEMSKPVSNPEPKKGFESSGNDVLGGINLSRFEPK